MKATAQQRGFTLIELMIVLVIIAVLAGVALPTYQSSVVNSTRKDAGGALLGLAQAMERYYAQTYSYTGAATGGADTGAPVATLYPSQAPLDGGTPYYNLTIFSADDDEYVIRATPIAGTRQAGDGFLQINSLGQRFWDKNNDASLGTDEDTWER